MEPLIKKNNHKRLFLVLILVFLACPFIVHLCIDRQTAYDAVPLRMGPYHYLSEQILHEKAPIDFLFLGSSDMNQGFNIDYLRKDWAKKHKKSFNIIMLAASWRGFDKLYFFLKDVLEHRQIKFVLLSVYGRNIYPHNASKYLYNIYDHNADFSYLPIQTRLAFYAESLFGVPKLLYNKIFPPNGMDSTSKDRTIAKDYGALLVDYGYDPRKEGEEPRSFVKRNDSPPHITMNEVVYFGGESNTFKTPYPMNAMEMYFYNLIVKLCKDHHTKLALIQMPFPTDDKKSINLYQWSFDKKIPTIAIPKGVLFPNMSQHDIEEFYNNSTHFNNNGALYISKALSDILYGIFEGSTHEQN